MSTISNANKAFFIGAGSTFFIALLYPISIILRLGSEGVRWVQNDPAYSFFVLLILPLAVGTFLRIFHHNPIRHLKSRARIVLSILLCVMVLFAAFLASQEVFRGPVIAPHLLSQADKALHVDNCLRESIRAVRSDVPHTAVEPSCKPLVGDLFAVSKDKLSQHAKQIYEQVPQSRVFTSYSDVFVRGSLSAYVSIFFDIFAGIFVMLVLWHILVLITTKRSRTATECDALILVYGLLIIWFPLRMYSEWYINYYSLGHFSDYAAFWFLLIVAVLAIPLLVIVLKPGRPVLVFSTVNGTVLAILGLLNQFKPSLISAMATFLESMPFSYYVALALLIFVVLTVMIYTMLDVSKNNLAGNENNGVEPHES